MTSQISLNSFYWFLCDIGAIRPSYPFIVGHLGVQSMPLKLLQRAQKSHFGAKSRSSSSKLVEQCGTRVEQVRAHPWCCIGTVLGVREGHVGVPEGSQKGPKRPKTAFLGHKQIWWLQTDGTVWNKGGSSQGTSPVMHWNSFAGQGGPSRGTRGLPKGSKTAKNSLFRP